MEWRLGREPNGRMITTPIQKDKFWSRQPDVLQPRRSIMGYSHKRDLAIHSTGVTYFSSYSPSYCHVVLSSYSCSILAK